MRILCDCYPNPYQLWRQVGTPAALPATASGRLLLVKLGVFVVLVGVAALSRS